MANVVVVFPKIEDAKSIRNLLVRNGYDVYAVCSSGAQALSAAYYGFREKQGAGE